MFYWVKAKNHFSLFFYQEGVFDIPQGDSYSAFTVAELGEMLPETIFDEYCSKNGGVYSLSLGRLNKKHTAAYCYWAEWRESGKTYPGVLFVDDNSCNFIDRNEANVRAKCLIFLIENNLIKL